MALGVTSWILSILGIAIAGGIIDLFLPNGKISKYVKSIIATAAVLLIVLPLPGLLKGIFGGSGSGNIFDSKVEMDEKFLSYITDSKINYLERGLVSALEGKGIKGLEIEIKGEVVKNEINVKKVLINLKNLVIENKDEHIDKYRLIEGLVVDYLKIEKGLIIFYE